MKNRTIPNYKKWLILLILVIILPIVTLKAQEEIHNSQEDISAFAKKQEFIKDLNEDEYSYWFEYLKSLDNKNLKEYTRLYKTLKYKIPKNELKQFIQALEQDPEKISPFYLVIAKNAYLYSKAKHKIPSATGQKKIDNNSNVSNDKLVDFVMKNFNPNASFSFRKDLSPEFGNDKNDDNSKMLYANQENNIEEYRNNLAEEELKTATTYLVGGVAIVLVIVLFIRMWNKEQ